MYELNPSSDFICEVPTHLGERELSAFSSAVTELYGAEQARVSAEHWLDQLELMERSPRSARDWREVTIAAAALLANCVKAKSAKLAHCSGD